MSVSFKMTDRDPQPPDSVSYIKFRTHGKLELAIHSSIYKNGIGAELSAFDWGALGPQYIGILKKQ